MGVAVVWVEPGFSKGCGCCETAGDERRLIGEADGFFSSLSTPGVRAFTGVPSEGGLLPSLERGAEGGWKGGREGTGGRGGFSSGGGSGGGTSFGSGGTAFPDGVGSEGPAGSVAGVMISSGLGVVGGGASGFPSTFSTGFTSCEGGGAAGEGVARGGVAEEEVGVVV